jgi:SAM-dependent methyltransferase
MGCFYNARQPRRYRLLAWDRGNVAEAFTKFSRLVSLDEEGDDYIGYLYISGVQNGVEQDLGPFKFSWKKRSSLFVKIEFDGGVTMRAFDHETKVQLEKHAKENNFQFTEFLLRTIPVEDYQEIEEEIKADDQTYEEEHEPAQEEIVVEPDQEAIQETTEAVEDKGKKKKKVKKVRKIKSKRDREIKLRERKGKEMLEECESDLEFFEKAAIILIGFFITKNDEKPLTSKEEMLLYENQMYSAVAFKKIMDKQGEQKAVYRSMLKSGRFQMLTWFLRSNLHDLEKYIEGTESELLGFAGAYGRDKLLLKNVARQISSLLPPEDKRHAALTTKEARLTVPSTDRVSSGYKMNLFSDFFFHQNRIPEYLKRFSSFLDIGSGRSIGKADYFLTEVRTHNPRAKTYVTDLLYDLSTKTSAASAGAPESKEDLIAKGKQMGHEVLADPAQNLKHIPDSSVDFVTASWSFDKFNEENEGTKQALRELARVMMPGGVFRAWPINFNPSIYEYITGELGDVFEIKALDASEETYEWMQEGYFAASVIIEKKKDANPEKLAKLKKESAEWVKTHLHE